MASSSLYIVNPRSDFLSYISADVIAAGGFAPGAVMGDLPSTTVAALAPDDFHISLCDENLSAIDFNHPADWIAITGKVNQRKRMAAVADEFRRRGKRVIIGGLLATLSPAELRGHCDIMVTGEAEEIAGEFFAHLRNGNPQEHYIGGQPDLRTSPRPRWDLYPNHRALTGVVQTSRGCPFDCEFCDVIQYAGRKQRHKPIANVLAELDQLYALGYRYTFLADDNFTAYRSRCKELLAAMAWWRRDHPMDFFTQVSIDAARDEELLDMCVDAGVTGVFIGIETPNPESLRETGKRQNLRIDLTQQVKKFIERGICVMGGMIVGFDSDRSDIFQTQFDFAMSSSVPIFTLGALMASETTPLRARIEREGRLITGGPNTQAVPWGSNIQPRHMTMDELQAGLQTLCNKLYSPAAFGERMLMFIENFAQVRGGAPSAQNDESVLREIDRQALQVAANVRHLGEKEGRMWNRVVTATARRPAAGPYVTRMLFHYAQARFMFQRASYWEPRLAA